MPDNNELFARLRSFDFCFDGYLSFFNGYTRDFLQGKEETNRLLRLKIEHSWRVLDNAWRITAGQANARPDGKPDTTPGIGSAITQDIAAGSKPRAGSATDLSATGMGSGAESGPNPEPRPGAEPGARLRKTALLAALFHDLGRFEQLLRYHTFADAASVNHGILGAQLLRRLDVLANEPELERKRITAAVLLHNRRSIPAGLEHGADYALRVVRDADKIDIVFLMAGFLGPGCTPDDTILMHLKDEPDKISLPFADITQASRTLFYTDMRYVNDFRVLLCSWMRHLNFRESAVIMQQQGHITTIAQGLSGVPAAQEKIFTFLASVVP